jgi:hypothetical protein
MYIKGYQRDHHTEAVACVEGLNAAKDRLELFFILAIATYGAVRSSDYSFGIRYSCYSQVRGSASDQRRHFDYPTKI